MIRMPKDYLEEYLDLDLDEADLDLDDGDLEFLDTDLLSMELALLLLSSDPSLITLSVVSGD